MIESLYTIIIWKSSFYSFLFQIFHQEIKPFSNISRKTKTSKKMEFNIQDEMGLGWNKSPAATSAQKLIV